jgi:EAL domain-containing protein (putative c-di-GMP-specific phosphodiesterase class I)
MSHRLGFEVVAEGVETEDQFEAVAELGVDLVQGYLVSKAVSSTTIDRMLDASLAEPSRAA